MKNTNKRGETSVKSPTAKSASKTATASTSTKTTSRSNNPLGINQYTKKQEKSTK